MKNEKLKIIVASGKGGVGKSMLASGLAMLFSERHKIVVVDCDVDAPNLHLWLGQGEKWDKVEKISTNERPVIDYKKCNGCGKCVEICAFGALGFQRPVLSLPHHLVRDSSRTGLELNPYFCEGCGACEVVCLQKAIKMEKIENAEIRIKKNVFGFSLISAQLYPGETGSGKIVDEIKSRAEKFAWEIMIFDSPAGTGCPVIAAIKDVNFAALITEPTPSGLSDLKRVLTVINHFKIPFGVVVNKWDINSELSRKIEKEFHGKILGKIAYDKRIFQAIANLIPIMETNLPVKKEITLIKDVIAQFPSTKFILSEAEGLRTGIARSSRTKVR